ncbi:MAG: Ig-like domain-containing protein [Treponema sp.]|nr:Ig-like domain-containing protein [Treponema sp.]MCL2250955.1 Ig-like domain-containing protein [Treponema sp.]
MTKKLLFLVVVLTAITGVLWAGGGKDNLSLTAEDPSGFSDKIDASERKDGKYNYFLEATDRAGNVTISGPENIFLDRESDLPRVTIVNPLPYMRVQGNMNIVGLAFDDDGVGSVELTVNRGIDGRGEEILRVTAVGTDFWSYFLDTTDGDIWTDGNYTITAWAVDINGLSGISSEFKAKQHKKSVVFWRLDRKKPEITITSHEIGALVAGNVRLRGTIADGNGINAFSYSLNEGETYIPVKTSVDRRTGINNWDITINTPRIFEDGPAVIWFQGVDGNGSIGNAAHLLFINNTGPDVKIVYPEPTTVVNGIFSIAGYAKHPVGLKKVTWKAGTASGEFELLPGNHWWSAEVDIRNQKLTNIDVEIRAEDVSGNVTTRRQRYRVDQARDLPVVTITEPVAGILNNELGLVVKGTASDDDGIESIFYSLNGGAPIEVPSNGNFQFLIAKPPEGTHNLEFWAKDITGVVGNKVAVRGIVVPVAPPSPSIVSFTKSSGRTPVTENFYTGMTIKPEAKMTMNLAVKANAAPASASVTIGSGTAIPLRLAASKELFTSSVAFPENTPEGLTTIRLTVTEKSGREIVYEEFVFVSFQVPSTVQDYIRDEEGNVVQVVDRLVFPPVPFAFSWVRPNTLEDGRIILGSADEVLMGISTVHVRGVTASSNAVSVQLDNNGRILLRASQEGDLGQVTLRIQTDEGVQTTQPFRMVADFEGPSIALQNIAENSWVRTNVPVRFNTTSRNRITAVDYSLDMGSTWVSFGAITAEYNRTIELNEIEDGSICILIKATNDSGKYSVAKFTVLKDSQAPEAEVIMPIVEAGVNGTIRMAFSVKDSSSINTITYNRPARAGAAAITKEVFNINNWESNFQPRFFEVLMDSTDMPLDANMRFVFTDRAGNTSEITSYEFVIDQEMDIPIAHIILPLENEVITNDFIVSGIMFDDDEISHIQWRIDNGQFQRLEAKNGFSIPIPISSLTDNEHSVTVIAEDIYGVRSEAVTTNFRVSLSEPLAINPTQRISDNYAPATMIYPQVETVIRDSVVIRGSTFDRNGIKMVQVSLDNGNTFNNVVAGTPERPENFGTPAEVVNWNYRFNTRILKDGAHVIFVRVFDNYDIPATYADMINVDNTPPEIILDSPGDGTITVGTISVMGRTLDPNLSEVRIELSDLQGRTLPLDLRSYELEKTSISPATIIRRDFNLSAMQGRPAQPDSYYNIAVIAVDLAGNETRISRNVELARGKKTNTIEILYPLNNETVSGSFYLYGHAGGADKAETVTLRINGTDSKTEKVDDTGYFRFSLESEDFIGGNNDIRIHSDFGGQTVVLSRENYKLIYEQGGPWVTIDSFNFGNFAYDRPYVYGRTGYSLSDEDKELLADRSTNKAVKASIQAKQPSFTEISFDNGRTFIKTEKGKGRNQDYRYRLETGDMIEGMHFILIRSTMKNGETAVTRMLVQVDKTFPEIRLISPEAGERYNQEIAFSASATDDIELSSLTYNLRVGDKAMYAVPGFLQGLYFEAVIPPFLRQLAVENDFKEYVPTMPFGGGSTYMDIAMGLSFFDDNVKIQFQYGWMTQKDYESLGGDPKLPVRYGGQVLGLKLLASIYSLPFGAIWGPDWEWLSATFAIGATFSYFNFLNEYNDQYNNDNNLEGDKKRRYTQSGQPTWMSALLLQIEFPRVTLPKRKSFRTFSLFTEGQLWFVPTDVANDDVEVIIPKVVLGARLYIF